MDDLKETIERLIKSYEKNKNIAAIKSAENKKEEECFGCFVLELKDLLAKMGDDKAIKG